MASQCLSALQPAGSGQLETPRPQCGACKASLEAPHQLLGPPRQLLLRQHRSPFRLHAPALNLPASHSEAPPSASWRSAFEGPVSAWQTAWSASCSAAASQRYPYRWGAEKLACSARPASDSCAFAIDIELDQGSEVASSSCRASSSSCFCMEPSDRRRTRSFVHLGPSLDVL